MQIVAVVVSLVIAAVGITLFVLAIRSILATLRIGQPLVGRRDAKGARWVTMLRETLGHTRMLQWTVVGAGHWFVFIGFGLLFLTLVTAFGQLFDAHFALPLIGHWFLFEWVSELFTTLMLVAIVAFICYRASRPRDRARGTRGRFFGSTMWQGYFVESVILLVGLCIAVLRGAEYAISQYGSASEAAHATGLHFPFSFWIGHLLSPMSESGLANLIYTVAMIKIIVSFTWMIVISRNLTMGVAWHRFSVFPNIWFKRHASGRTSLGGLQPMTVGGVPIDFENIEDLDEDAALGVGKVEDFAWKGILDFTTCTECGRCQSQCPAWNTEKPLSPKLLITALRDHAYAKAPYLQAAEADRPALLESSNGGVALAREVERPLVGETGDDWFYMPESGAAVIDPEVLWNCTSCGACVQQCPVDIEHVDHIMDMRRYQVLVESNFPTELNQLFRGLENKGNPWNMSPNARMDWAKGLDFEVRVVGGGDDNDPADLSEVEWLFWVGCAGAYEDRAKKTTRAVAELLDRAGVSFAVLGDGETCSGDPARRAGNEFVFQGLAMQNAEVFKDTKATKVVSTCAHCFNTLKNEYSQFGVELEVVHHTQLLNRLVREGKLTPVAADTAAPKRSLTYHDPCYLGRHNQVYSPPRELLSVIPATEFTEMPRNSERSFCCGAGGARMWMEEKTGERINMNRTTEAVQTGADQIAVACPFCRVMLSDGLTSLQAGGTARDEVEVLDVAQLLLAAVQRPEAANHQTAQNGTDRPVETQAEPRPGDITQSEDTVTDHPDVGADAAASIEPDPEAEAARTTDPGSDPLPDTGGSTASQPGVAGGEDDPQAEASTEDQAGQASEPSVNDPAAGPGDDRTDGSGEPQRR